MALTEEGLRSAVRSNHPDWNEETVERFVQSQLAAQTEQDRNMWTDEWFEQYKKDSKWPEWTLDHMAWNATKMWQDISDWWRNLISDEEAEAWNGWTKFADKAVEIWSDIAWWLVRSVWSTPKFWFDAVWLLWWSSEWWFWNTKKRAQELQDMWVDWVNSWIMAIEEWAQEDNLTSSNKNLFAQTIDQVINNPIIWEWIWALFKWLSKWVRYLWKAWKTTKAIEKTIKSAWAVANVADDSVKASKWIIGKSKSAVKNFFKDTKTWQTIARFAWWSIPVVQPFVDIAKPIYKWFKAAKSEWLRAWIAETIASWLDTAWQFLGNPYSYRLPRVWTYDQAQRLFGTSSEAYQTAADQQKFYDEHWYALKNALSQKTDDALSVWYDQQWIAQDKRLTIDQLKKELWDLWGSFINNYLSWARDVFQALDPWTYNQAYYNSVKAWESWTLEQTETTPRWRLTTSWGLNIDINDWTITDSEWNVINTEDLTDEQKNDIIEATMQFQSWDYSWLVLESEYQKPDESINITWLDQNTAIWPVVEWFVQNWMLTQASVNSLMQWKKSADATNIVMNLNEASKQFAHQIVNLYTPEEINKNPELQWKVMEQLWAYERWFNQMANVINNVDESTYQKKKWVYWYRDAMVTALNQLSERDQNLINSNVYRQAIDYNNSLEEWFDEKWMKAATSIVQITDDWIVNKLLRDDNSDIVDALWLSWLWNTAVNPNVVWAATMLWDVRSAVASNAAYLIDTAVVNFINNNLIEWYLWNLVSKGVMNKILPARVLANKQYNWLKWATSEAMSEPLENLLDAITMVDSADTNYDWMPWLLIWALQWWFAWYASSKSNYSTINDYFSDPKNRLDIMSRMWIDISKISDPQKKATMLAVTNQLFDNVIGVMKDAYAKSNYWVENLAQALAVTLINNDMADYATDVLDTANLVINLQQEAANRTNNWVWTQQQINDIFWSTEMYDKYLKWENFSFSPTFINAIRNWWQLNFNWFTSDEIVNVNNRIAWLQNKFNTMSKRAAWLAVASQKIKWHSLQEVFDKLAPKVDINWVSVKPALTKEQKDEVQVLYSSMDPKTSSTEMYVLNQLIAWANTELHTIWDLLWIWEWSIAWDSKKWDFKKTVKIVDENWNEQRISIRDYIYKRINEAEWLEQDQKAFIANMLTRTTVLWINSYFKDDGSLSRMWKDFFNSVMPAVKWMASAKQFFDFMNRAQTTKETNAQKSRNKALSERWTSTHKTVQTIIIWWQPVRVWEKIEIDDRQIWNLTINWKPYTLRMLERDWEKSYVVDWVKKTLSLKDWAINVSTEVASKAQEPISNIPTIDENWKFLFNEDKRLDSLSQEEFDKEYEETEAKRKEAWRKYYAIEKDIKANPYHSESDAIDPRVTQKVERSKEAYKMKDKLKRMDESKERRKKNNTTQQQNQTNVQQSTWSFKEDLNNYKEEQDKNKWIDKKAMWQAFVDWKSEDEQYKAWWYVKVWNFYVDPRLSKKALSRITPKELQLMEKLWIITIDYNWNWNAHYIPKIDWSKKTWSIAISNNLDSDNFDHLLLHEIWHHIYRTILSENEKETASQFNTEYTWYIKWLREWKTESAASLWEENFCEWFALYMMEKLRWNTTFKNWDFEQHHMNIYDNIYNDVYWLQTTNNQLSKVEDEINNEVLEWDVEITSSVEDKTQEEIKEDLWDTRISWAIVEPDIILDLIDKSNKLKSKLPIMERRDANVNVRLNWTDWSWLTLAEQKLLLWKEPWKYSDEDLNIAVNSDAAKKDYQIVTITYKENWQEYTRDFYAVPQLNYATHSEDLWEDDWQNKAIWFNSFVLLSANSEDWEYIEKVNSTIFRWPEEELSRPNNNYIYQVLDKDWNPVNENRILNFTQHVDQKTWALYWRMATTIQLNRLSSADRERAYKSWKVFLVTNKKETYNWKEVKFEREVNIPTDQWIETVKYDYRPIYTTSDMVMNPHITDINIGNANINIVDKKYDRSDYRSQTEYKWIADEQTPQELQEMNEFLVREDPTRATTKQEKQAVKDLKEVDHQYEEAYEEAMNDAIDLTDDPNISEEESINEHNKSIDPNIYNKAKTKLQLIASEWEWFPIWNYIDLDRLSTLVSSDTDAQYWDALEKCIIDKEWIKNFTDEEAYNFMNKLALIEDRFWFLYSQWYFDEGDWFRNANLVIQDLIWLIDNDILTEKVDRIVMSNEHKIHDFDWMDVKDVVSWLMVDWYSPVEIAFSIDENWKILWTNIWNWEYSRPFKSASWLYHSHPNWSFFSNTDFENFRTSNYTKVWLILPWWVLLSFNYDDKFKSLIYDDNWKINKIYDSWWYMCDDIVIAIKFSLDHWSFDEQQWWEFTALANEMKDIYEKYWLDETTLWSFWLKSTKIIKWICKKIWMDLSWEAVASWNSARYYMFKKWKLSREAEWYDYMTEREAKALENMPDVLDESTKYNKEIVDNNTSLTEQTRNQIVEDMKVLWLSLERLDSETMSDIFIAYTSWKWMDDVIKYLASKTRSGQIDNYLKNILIKNWVLDPLWEYDWQSLDMAISLQWAKSFAVRKSFWNNLTPEQMRELKFEFEKTTFTWYSQQQISDFVKYYMDAQIFRIWKWKEFSDYKPNAIKTFKAVFNNFKAQSEDINEESVTKATFVSNWMSNKTKDIVIQAIAQDIVENSFNMNYNNISEKFRTAVENAVKKQLEDNWIVTLWNQYSNASLKWNELVPQVEAMPDDARFAMAKSLKEAWLIWWTIYNYLMKVDPTISIVDWEWDITNGIISSVIIKSMDEALWTDKWVFISPKEKLQVFLDIYRYYSLWWNTYEWLIDILKKKYLWRSIWLTKLVNMLEEDMNNSKNWLYDDTIINEISKPTEYIEDENNPYNIFIRSQNVSNPNSEDIIVEALLKQYNLNPDSFFSVVKYAPLNIKSRITEYMRNENDKEHWNNKALWIVMSFLSASRNKELLNNLALQRASQKHTDTNLDLEVNTAVEKILTDWNDDSIIMNPAITALLYRETWIAQLDLTKWTVLYIWWNQWYYKPNAWETLDWKQTFPLKIVRNLDDIHAWVNIIVPEWSEFSLPAWSSTIHKIVRVRVWVKNWLMVRAPRTSYHNDDSMVWNIISWLWKMWYNISQKEWFVFTTEQEKKLKQKRTTKNLYWNIYKWIVVPSLPWWRASLSRNDFNKLLTTESMSNTSFSLLKSVIASKSPDDKVNAAIILINQATNWQLALKTDILWTQKSIDIISASEKFEKEFISKLDSNSSTYERDKTLLWNFFTAYTATLMQLSDPEAQREESTWAWITWQWFTYLIQNHQAAIWLMKQIFDDSWFPTSKYAYLPWENVLERKDENFFDSMKSLFTPNEIIVKAQEEWRILWSRPARSIKQIIAEIDSRIQEVEFNWRNIDKEILSSLKNLVLQKKLEIKEIKKSDLKQESKDEKIKQLNLEIKKLNDRIKNQESNKRVTALETNTELLRWLLKVRSLLQKNLNTWDVSPISYTEFEENSTERKILEDIERMEDEENQFEVMDLDSNEDLDNVEETYVESENFQDKDAIVFATIFNTTIAENLYDMDARTITYDEKWNNKFISDDLLSMITREDWSAISSESTLNLEQTETDITDAKSNNNYTTALNIWDTLALQTMISSNKSDEEELDRILNWMFQLPDWVSENDPIAILFNKTKERIIRNPDSFASEINKLIDNDLVNFDVYTGDMVTTHKPNRDKIKWLARKIAEAVIKFNMRPISESDLNEARNELSKFFQDNTWKQITPADDQIKLANEIVDLYDNRNWEEKRILYAPWFAWVWKSTTVVASLKAIKDQSWAWSDDIERIQHWMKVISDNFFNDSKNWYQANKIYSYKNSQWPLYMKVVLNNKVCYIKFTWKNIKTHNELKNEYTQNWVFNEDKFIADYTNKTNWAWTREWLLRLFEMWEWNDRWSYSNTRYMIEDFEYIENPSDNIEKDPWFINIDIHWLWNNIPSKKFKDWTYQWWTKEPIQWTWMIQWVYIFTKNKATIQAINDLMQEENGLYWIQTATMDSNLVTYSPSTMPWIWYWAYPVIRTDKQLNNCLILIDETQWVDTATLNAIVEWYKENNNIVMLWDPVQRSQNTIFKQEVQKDDNDVIQLTTVFRWPQDMQDTNKLNNIWHEQLVESWYVMILPSDSEHYKPYTDVTELFDLPWTTMYSARTNEKVAEINKLYFERATGKNNVKDNETIENVKNHITTSTWSYAQRTKENAQNSDVTIAFAFDFNTAWEKATKNAATPHWKYLWVQLTNMSYDSLNERMSSIWNFYKDKWPIVINIAGNWMYTLKKHSSKDQEYYNKLLKEAIWMMIKSWANIKKIISWWQTWIDEAWIKAAQELWLDWEVHTTSDYKFRWADWIDVANKEKFINRFIPINKNTWNNKPIPTMVIDALMINKDWKQVTDKWIINKRYHQWIDLSEYSWPTKIWDDEIYFKIEWYNDKKEPSDIKVFVPLLPNTKSENVEWIRSKIQKKYPKAKVEISTTAFAITTAKESWKTVKYLIMDQDITNPEYDIYADSNTKDAYDSFTRWSETVYYPANASNVLFMPMEEIHNLMENNDPNITLSAPVAEITTTTKTIRFPRFYANDWARDASSILSTMYSIAPEWSIDKEWMETMANSLNNLSNTERLYNTEMLATNIAEWKKDYWDKRAEWNWEMLEWLKRQIAFKWNDIRDKVRDELDDDIKSINKFNRIDWWVYWKQIKTPNVNQWAMFSSFQVANNELTYESFIKWNSLLKNWDRWMYLIPTKTIDSKWKEVRSLIPAKVSWNTKNISWVLTANNENNKKQRIIAEHDKRMNEYLRAFDVYKTSMWKKQKQKMLKIFDMLDSDIARYTQDEDFKRKVDIQKPSWQLIKWQVWQEILSPNWEISLINWELANWKYTNEYYTQEKIFDVFNIQEWNLGEAIRNRLPIRKFYATSSDYEYEINELWKKKDAIINRLTSLEYSDDLKNDLIDFVDTIYSIDHGWTTPWIYDLDNSEIYPEDFDVTFWAPSIDISSAMQETDDQTSCKL